MTNRIISNPLNPSVHVPRKLTQRTHPVTLWKDNTMNEDELHLILYPRRFMSQQEVDTYVSGDVVTCLLCNKSFANLSRHIRSGHGADPKKYRDILNIPRTQALLGSSLVARATESSKNRYDSLSEEDKQKQKEFNLGRKGTTHRVVCSFAKEKQAAPSEYAKAKGLVRKLTRIVKPCTRCGDLVDTGLNRVNRVVHCLKCRRHLTNEGTKRRQQAKRDSAKEKNKTNE